MDKIKTLFVCNHNIARSQMAEAFLNSIAGDRFFAESAGFEPGTLNPLVVEAMKEAGIDISKNNTKKVFDFYKQGRIYNYVITVCDQANSERCPIFPGVQKTLHWSFPDPSMLEGTHDQKLESIRIIRDSIKIEIEKFIKQII